VLRTDLRVIIVGTAGTSEGHGLGRNDALEVMWVGLRYQIIDDDAQPGTAFPCQHEARNEISNIGE
jgi:hypothetical protein